MVRWLNQYFLLPQKSFGAKICTPPCSRNKMHFLEDDGLIASQTIFIKSAALHLLSFPDKSFFFFLLWIFTILQTVWIHQDTSSRLWCSLYHLSFPFVWFARQISLYSDFPCCCFEGFFFFISLPNAFMSEQNSLPLNSLEFRGRQRSTFGRLCAPHSWSHLPRFTFCLKKPLWESFTAVG